MRVKEATDAQLDEALAVDRAAFGDESVGELVAALETDPTARPALALLAWDDDEPVGHILFTAVRVEAPETAVAASILAPLAVVPSHQRRGVGGVLIEAGIERLQAAGIGLVFVLGHPTYYPRHGFEPAFPHGLEAPYPITPPEAWMVRALAPGLLGRVQGTVRCAEAMMRPELWRE